ncbi:hypothetical protein IFR04_015435 [Cadophora malorum]|uniref:Uncharacterized protein n=1 Tax=Cadophora malorum TaxID=108018 RepID=A0A8H7T0S6_9HELO|nr:hypothetical protein IFR04_015435 [Cadophora malorum]
MANNSQSPASQGPNASPSNEPKTYTTISRTWPQLPTNINSTSTSCSNLPNQTSTSGSATTSTPNEYNHTTHQHNTNTNNLRTPMTRWLAESQQQTPYNTIHSVENAHPGQGHGIEGEERMERGNGGNE